MKSFTVSEIYIGKQWDPKKVASMVSMKQETIFTLTNYTKDIPLFTAKQESINMSIGCFLSTDKHT